MSGDALKDHLLGVCEKENREIEDAAAALIARAAEGSVRDSLSLLDQILAMQEEAPTVQDVRQALGMADHERVVALFSALCEGDASSAVARAEEAATDGQEPLQIIKELQQICHHAGLFAAAGEEAETAAFYDDATRRLLQETAQKCGVGFLTRMWSLLIKTAEEFAHSYNAAATLEMGLIRICHAAALPSPEAAIRALSSRDAPAPLFPADKKKA